MARIAVLDDYQRVAGRLADWSRLAPHDVTFFHEPLGDAEAVAATLEPFDVVGLMRERTPFQHRSFHGCRSFGSSSRAGCAMRRSTSPPRPRTT